MHFSSLITMALAASCAVAIPAPAPVPAPELDRRQLNIAALIASINGIVNSAVNNALSAGLAQATAAVGQATSRVGQVTSRLTTPSISIPIITTPAITTPSIPIPIITTPAITTPSIPIPIVTTPALPLTVRAVPLGRRQIDLSGLRGSINNIVNSAVNAGLAQATRVTVTTPSLPVITTPGLLGTTPAVATPSVDVNALVNSITGNINSILAGLVA